MLLNRARANQIMDKYGLDGLVAAVPHNVYYLTDHWNPIYQMSQNFTFYAVLPRNEDAPAAIILPPSVIYHLEDKPTWVPNVVAYAIRLKPSAIGPRDYDTTTEEIVADDEPTVDPDAPPMPYPIRAGVPMLPRDQALLARYATQRGRLEPSALYALRRALREAGLDHGKLGFDDPRVLGWLNDIGTHVTGIDAINIFREIRMVKSPTELDIMRKVGRMTESALNAVIDAIEPGVPLASLNKVFSSKLTELGGRSEWIVVNIRGLAGGEIEANEIMKLDSVGSYRGYRGDVGRSVICGEPTEEMLRRARAVTRGLHVAYENIRPGKSLREITELTLKTVHDEGFPGFIIAGPHAVGLEHTDHPTSIGSEMPGTHEMFFEENMVFTLDMPYHEFGWGTTHVEDMIIVTKDGCEAITSMDTSLRVKALK